MTGRKYLPVISLTLGTWLLASLAVYMIGIRTVEDALLIMWPAAMLVLPPFTLLMDIAIAYLFKEDER